MWGFRVSLPQVRFEGRMQMDGGNPALWLVTVSGSAKPWRLGVIPQGRLENRR